jgi:hypothetical protein
MLLDVVRRGAEEPRLVPEQPETGVAPLAQQLPQAIRLVIMLVIMVTMPGRRLTTDGARLPLGRSRLDDGGPGHAVRPNPGRTPEASRPHSSRRCEGTIRPNSAVALISP